MVERTPAASVSFLRSYAWLMVIIGLLLLVGSGMAYLVNPIWLFETRLGAGLGLILLLAAMLLRPEVVRMALTGRPARYASNAIIMSLAFLGILGLLNYLGYKYNQDYDLTETGDFTLSEQTIQILSQLDQPVQVFGFLQASDPRLTMAKDYLERYAQHTKFLTYEFHDPNVEPALAQSFELSNYGLVFVSGDKHYEAASVDEQTLTSGLVRVTGDAEKKVYFITGHGERNLDDTTPEGYSTVKGALERENYIVNTINLSTITTTVPAAASVLILAGPGRDLFETETQLLQTWLKDGGKLMVMADPLQPVPLPATLQEYGLAFGNDFAVDVANSAVTLAPEGLAQQLTTPMISQYPFHEITRDLNGFQSFFPFARSIAISSTDVSATNVAPLLTTSANSWAETDLASTQLEYTEGVDWPGPINIGAAAEDSHSGMRLVVFGNSSFAANQTISPQVANLDLFMNAVNWLAEEEELISIRPKQPTDRRLFLTPMQSNLTLLTTLIVIPLAVFGAGIAVWWSRR
ncbi:MAG TPA: GldG family protein [Anaerolineae bacterium]|nr:GldG family protein [Anaerolineae bacterium]